MAVIKFKKFEDADKFEKEGKGISWHFSPDKKYFINSLKFNVRIPFPPGVYKFKTFEEAEAWEREWWAKGGTAKRAG